MPTTTDYVDPYAARIAAQRELLAQPLAKLFTADQVAQRQAENRRQELLGQLGMLSGDEALGGVGGQVYKQALAERAPRTTDQGTFDPLAGSYTLHPEVQRQRQEAELARLEEKSAAGAAAWAEGRQREAERREAAEQNRQFLATQNAATRAATGAARSAAQDARTWTVEDRMADDFTRDTKTPQLVLGAHRNMQAIAQKGDAASDMAFIFSYMKLLDPTSVVREGEFANAQNATGVPERILNLYNRARTGNFLNPQQRAEMLGTAQRLAAQAEQDITGTAETYAQKAARRGLSAENITGRPTMLPKATAAADAGGQSGTKQQQRQQPVRVSY